MQAALEARGVKVDKRWAEKRLTEELAKLEVIKPVTEEVAKNIASIVAGEGRRPLEEMTMKLDRTGQNPVTPGGLIIPWSALTAMKPTDWHYYLVESVDLCAVKRVMYNGHEEFVREYSRTIHGEDFLKLGRGFVEKKNRK